MNCENKFLVDDPYSDLDFVDADDILVFNVNCREKKDQDTYQVKSYGPEPEEHVQAAIDTFLLDPNLFEL